MEVTTKNEFIKRVADNFKQEAGSVEEISSIFIEKR